MGVHPEVLLVPLLGVVLLRIAAALGFRRVYDGTRNYVPAHYVAIGGHSLANLRLIIGIPIGHSTSLSTRYVVGVRGKFDRHSLTTNPS